MSERDQADRGGAERPDPWRVNEESRRRQLREDGPRPGQVDVLGGLPQIPPFAVLDAAASSIDLDGLSIRICSLEHLMEMKRASDRPRDRDDLEALQAAQEDP
jgi:hypothetical protein